MPALHKIAPAIEKTARACSASAGIFAKDVGHGLLEVSHNTLALVGLAGIATVLFVGTQPEWRQVIETETRGWLQARQDARTPPAVLMAASLREPDAIARATASDPSELTKQQKHVAQWIARRYRVAPEPISRLVKEAWAVGTQVGLDPTLILAIMAVESRFNPFAQSAVGAQGLMQVMTGVHGAKYEAFGGNHAAFDPVTNLRVGVLVLKECIARTGSLESGLRSYVGASNLVEDGGYASKVLAEQSNLRQVSEGRTVAVTAPLPQAVKPVKPDVEAEAEAEATIEPIEKAVEAPNVKQVALLH